MEKDAYFVTAEGMQRLRDRLDYMRNVRLPGVRAGMEQALADDPGSLGDNTGYLETQEDFELIEGLVQELQYIVEHAEVVTPDDARAGTVQTGSQVTLLDQEGGQAAYQIVDGIEMSPGQPGQISSDSPVGLGLLGKRAGDEVEVAVPDGIRRYTIVSIR